MSNCEVKHDLAIVIKWFIKNAFNEGGLTYLFLASGCSSTVEFNKFFKSIERYVSSYGEEGIEKPSLSASDYKDGMKYELYSKNKAPGIGVFGKEKIIELLGWILKEVKNDELKYVTLSSNKKESEKMNVFMERFKSNHGCPNVKYFSA